MLKNLAPDIVRKRLVIEGFFKIDVNEEVIEQFFKEICQALELRMYGNPTIFSPSGMGKEGNQGYDAFVPLIDSGISLYVWTQKKFTSCIIYTCKSFDEKLALSFTKEFFQIKEIASLSF